MTCKSSKENKNMSIVRSKTISRWTTLIYAHVKRLIIIDFSFSTYILIYMSVKSSPITVNGLDSATHTLGNGGGSGAL